MGDRLDPMIAGLLEGAAFLAARVQLKIKHEFSEFTTNLLDQLAPHYLAPTPSALLAQVQPKFGDPALREGRTIPRGAYLDAAYRELERNIACRFALCAPITLWPFEIAKAEYFAAPGPLQALGCRSAPDCAAGLRLQLTVRSAEAARTSRRTAEAQTRAELRFSACRVKDPDASISSARVRRGRALRADVRPLPRRLFSLSRCVRRSRSSSRAAATCCARSASREDEALVPNDKRMFRGFDFLREYFAFPRRFLGFDAARPRARRAEACAPRRSTSCSPSTMSNPRLAAAVRKDFFALYAAPAVNLFEKTLDRIPVKSNRHEYPVVPDRSRTLDFEPNRIVNVFAHIPGRRAEGRRSSRSIRPPRRKSATGLCYTVRRLPRRRTAEERKYGQKSDYTGTDMFLSLGERSDPEEVGRVAELSVQRSLHQPSFAGASAGRRRRRGFPVSRRRRSSKCAASPARRARSSRSSPRWPARSKARRSATSPGASSIC